VELYPWSRRPTAKVFRCVPENRSLQSVRRGICNEIRWRELKGSDLRQRMPELTDGLAGRRAYISIDKDCLASQHALTNWEEGLMGIDDLAVMLSAIRDTLDIVGVDITGDYSPPKVKGAIKALCSRLDHPRQYSARGCGEDVISAINEKTNLRLLDILLDQKSN